MTLEIRLRTLTPLWTGGVDQAADRLHETGLIGSLRWWYEALVRGLGGYACDPTDDKSKCKEYDPKLGQASVCAACYLFGTTGWARLFRLRVLQDDMRLVPLHFYTTLPANKRWLGSIFGGEKRNNQIDGMTVPFGQLRLEIVGRGVDEDYALSQVAWTLDFIAKFGGLGAKLQHGFGQIALSTPLTSYTTTAEQNLRAHLHDFKSGINIATFPTCQRFFSYPATIPATHPILQALLTAERVGRVPGETSFIPCAFDLRYKGGVLDDKQIGFRTWLSDRGWRKEDMRALLGETQAARDEDRTASRVYFGMPWRTQQGSYTLRVFGFVPPQLKVKGVSEQVKKYVGNLFGTQGG